MENLSISVKKLLKISKFWNTCVLFTKISRIFTIPCFFGRRSKKQRDGLGIDRYNFEFCNVQFSNVWNDKLTYYLICSFINIFSVRVLTFSSSLQQLCILEYLESRAGNIIFGCGKKPFGTVLGLYQDSEKNAKQCH